MATGGYSDFHASGSGRGGERSSHFISRGRGREMSHYQNVLQPNERNYDDERNRLDQYSSHDHTYYAHRGRGGKLWGHGRSGRRSYKQHYMKADDKGKLCLCM